jgi:segregation and condensation protein B
LREDSCQSRVNLQRIDGKWTFRTATDLSWLLSKETTERRNCRAAIETLAIIAYHRPVTRSESRNCAFPTSAGSVDVLLETDDPSARPPQVAWAPGDLWHTAEFLSHFGLDAVGDLPGLEELKGSGMFDGAAGRFLGALPSDDPGAARTRTRSSPAISISAWRRRRTVRGRLTARG